MRNGHPFLSVIIPVYNGAKFLSETVESVRRQNYPDLEVLIIDDGSTDQTAKIASRLKGNVSYYYQRRKGVSAARNHGIKLSGGQWVGFLDQDDLWAKNKLGIQTAAIRRHPDAKIVMGRVQVFKSRKKRKGLYKISSPFAGFFLGSALIKKSVFTKVGLFDESLSLREDGELREDGDWFLRAMEINVPKVLIKDVVLYYRLHRNNMTRGLWGDYMAAMLKVWMNRRREIKSGVSYPKP